jgi:hypothetical protein
MNFQETYNGLPSWAKGIVVVGSFAAVGYTSYLIYKKVQAINASRDAKREVEKTTDELKKLNVKPTLMPSQIDSVANQLFTAMNGYGTDYNSILKALVYINNNADMLSVIKAYGVRELSSGNFNPEPNLTGTLGQAFSIELGSDQRTAVNNLLARKGVTYRF